MEEAGKEEEEDSLKKAGEQSKILEAMRGNSSRSKEWPRAAEGQER